MIYVLSGGQTGATLTVTSSGAGTITVSNTTLGKSYSKSVTAGGSVVFKGLKTGTWTIKLTDGSKTSTKTITITSDYSTNIAYFSASIKITYPAKSTCVVKNSSGQTVASNTNTGTSTKTWTATVNAKGAYTVTATATDGSGKSKSQDVSIASDGQSVSVSLSYSYYLIKNGVTETTFTKNGTGNVTSNTSEGRIEVVAGTGYPGKYVYYSTVVDISEYDTLYIDGFGYVPSTDVSASVRVGDNYESKTGIVNLNQDRSVVSIPLEGIKADITSVYATIVANSWIYNEDAGLYRIAASYVYNMWLE